MVPTLRVIVIAVLTVTVLVACATTSTPAPTSTLTPILDPILASTPTSPPTLTPTPTLKSIERYVCKCAFSAFVEAWVDQNENLRREPEEAPLEGVIFKGKWYDDGLDREGETFAASDQTGYADIVGTGCGCESMVVYAEAPTGYRLTTRDRVNGSSCPRSARCAFGFIALVRSPTREPVEGNN
jgi:hypothetical protein